MTNTNTFKTNSFEVVQATSSRKSDVLIVNCSWDYASNKDMVWKFNDHKRHKARLNKYYDEHPERKQWIVNDIKTKWKDHFTRLQYNKDYTIENGIIKLK